VEYVQGQLTSIYGSPVFEHLDPQKDPALRLEQGGGLVATGRMKLQKGPHLPLLTWRDFEENDPVLSLFGAVGAVRADEVTLCQLIITGRAKKNWAQPYLRQLLRLKRRGFGAFDLRDLGRVMALFLGVGLLAYFVLAGTFSGIWISIGRLMAMLLSGASLWLGAPLIVGQTPGARWDESLEELVEEKIKQPAYRTEIRLAVAADSGDRARQLLQQVVGAYNIFTRDSGNQLSMLAPEVSPHFTPASLVAHPSAASILNASELATMWHLPLADIPDLLPATRVGVSLPVPDQVQDPDGLYIGEARKSSGMKVPVYLPAEALKRHILLVGRTRMGKTTLAQHVACWAMAQKERALVVVDPHRDMLEALLGLIPEERIKDVVHIDLAADDFMPGFNVLDAQQAGDVEKVVEAFIDVGTVLWAGYWGPRMVVPLRMLLLALALANTQRAPDQQFTILALPQLIGLSRERRSHFLREVLPADDPRSGNVIDYFETEYDDLTPSFQERVISPVLSKARAFEFNSRIRAMVGQPASSINPWRFIAEHKIVLFHTGLTRVGQDFASFMGSLILNYVRRAIMAQGELPAEERVQATVIVDESQTMAAVDYASIMAQAQKFGSSMVMSTQGLALLDPALQRENLARSGVDRQLLANTDTLLVFRVGGEDALRISESEFNKEVNAVTLTNLPQFSAYVRSVRGREVVPPFMVETKPLMEPDMRIRAAVMALRKGYARPFEKAIEESYRSMRVILHHFGTQVAAATAVHDGAFGDLLGKTMDFPEALKEIVADPGSEKEEQEEMMTTETKVGTRAPQGLGDDVSELAYNGMPHEQLLDFIERIEGWLKKPHDSGEALDGTAPESA